MKYLMRLLRHAYLTDAGLTISYYHKLLHKNCHFDVCNQAEQRELFKYDWLNRVGLDVFKLIDPYTKRRIA